MRARSARNENGYQVEFAAAGASQVTAGWASGARQFQDVLRRCVPPVDEDYDGLALAERLARLNHFLAGMRVGR